MISDMMEFYDRVAGKINALIVKKDTIFAAMRVKVEESDLHGVSDFANDLREIDAEIKVLNEMLLLIKASESRRNYEKREN